MRRWLGLAARLYPKSWRDRYAREFACLLEDIQPRWTDVVDVLRGAVMMRTKTWSSYVKLVAAVSVAGAIVAFAVTFVIPALYVSTAVIRAGNAEDPQNIDRIQHAWQEVITRRSLSELIQRPNLDLYKSDRTRRPLEDVIEDMKDRGIYLNMLKDKGGTSVSVTFEYPDRYKAQLVANALTRKFVDAARASWAVAPANLPQVPVTPNRLFYTAYGLLAGLGIGTVVSFLRWRTKWTMKVTAFGLAGCAIAGGLSLLLPNQYVSRALFRVLPPPNADGMADWLKNKDREILSDQSLAEIIQRPSLNLYNTQRKNQPLKDVIAIMRQNLKVETLPHSHSAFIISFRYTDRFKAQQVVSALVTKFSDSEWVTTEADLMAAPPPRRTTQDCTGKTGNEYVDCITGYLGNIFPAARTMRRPKSAESLDLLDPASLPETPMAPNRWVLAGAGLFVGLFLGAYALRSKPAPTLKPA